MKPSRKCPVCGNADKVIRLYRQEFAVPDAYEGIPEIYDIVECETCGCVYDDLDASQDVFDRYYQRNSKYENLGQDQSGRLHEGYINHYRQIAQAFKEYLTPESAILDIGCATGGMLCALKTEGFHDVAGLEMSEACIANVKSMGIDCYRGGVINQDPALTKKFDLIIMMQVMEHIYDIESAMKNIRSMLKDGGMLYIDVPDAGRYDSHFIKPFYYFDMEHINHFTRQSLINLGIASDLKVIKTGDRDAGIGQNKTYPNIYVVYEKHVEKQEAKCSLIKCNNESIKRYIGMSASNWETCRKKIKEWEEQKQKIIIWGVGAFSLQYLKKGLEKCNIVEVVDSDTKKQGMTVNHMTVRMPDAIRGKDGTIVVTVALFQDQICRQITDMGITNEVYCL